MIMRILTLLALVLSVAACGPATSEESTDDTSIMDATRADVPTDPDAPQFAITITGDVGLEMTEVIHLYEVNADPDGTDLIFRDSSRTIVIGLNLPGTTSIAVGDFETSEAGELGGAAASFSYRADGDTFTGVDASGPITISAAGDSLAGTFAITFNELGGERSVMLAGTFDNLAPQVDNTEATLSPGASD